jgi:hypothetical protein
LTLFKRIGISSRRSNKTSRYAGKWPPQFAESTGDNLGTLVESLREPIRNINAAFVAHGLQRRAEALPCVCPDCQVEVQGSRISPRTVYTIAGRILLKRRIGLCPACEQRVCPVDRMLDIRKGYSPWVRETAATLISKMAYSEAETVFIRTTGLRLPQTSLQRLALDVARSPRKNWLK